MFVKGVPIHEGDSLSIECFVSANGIPRKMKAVVKEYQGDVIVVSTEKLQGVTIKIQNIKSISKIS